jgi:cyclopropane-fatty-acyl-phospholipid synthase
MSRASALEGVKEEAARFESRIYVCRLSHERLSPVPHRFEYPAYVYAIDLDELESLNSKLRLFGHNRFALASLWDKDYLNGEGSLRQGLKRYLEPKGLWEDSLRITLVTGLRYFNYVFNPVSFYYCYDRQASLVAAVAEVNNTFGERHLYILGHPEDPEGRFLGRALAKKDFHVSPFYDQSGDYEFFFSPLNGSLDIRIHILKAGEVDFRARLWGEARPLKDGELLRTIFQFPLTAALTMPRILWQAAKLSYQKRLSVYSKPYAASEMTLRGEEANALQGLSRDLVLRFFEKLRKGRLKLLLPNRQELSFGGQEAGVEATLRVGNYAFFRRLLLSGDIGLGESYQEGEWDSPDLTALLRLFGENMDSADDRGLFSATLGRLGNRLKHALHANTLQGSRENIEAHYDLSNELYALFLDPSWMYSSAVFAGDAEALEPAQRRKIAMILEKAQLRPGMKLLEIGSGWGSLAIEAASRGTAVTSITLSREQLRVAKSRALEAGLASPIDFKICDYRQVEGLYDRVVSVEMLEAVGHEYLGAYFASLERVLRPGGLAVIQVISVPQQRYEAYRRSCDWIQKHIFPGALCPSLEAVLEAAATNSSFSLESSVNIGPHYARTLALWRKNFLGASENIKALGFDARFLRTWDYYFSYCEAGFASRLIHNYQLVFRKGGRT